MCKENYLQVHAWAREVSRLPFTTEAWARPQASHVGYMGDKATLGKVFLQVLRFSLSIIITVLIVIH
jgi:hypothetical protein